MAIDHGAAEFPFLQLAAILRGRIEAGEFPAGRKIPSLIALQAEYNLSSMTVRRAIAVLAEEGLLVKVPGRGTFVTRPEERRLVLTAQPRHTRGGATRCRRSRRRCSR